jgi:membrane peptidoglycan carboxypeptidase
VGKNARWQFVSFEEIADASAVTVAPARGNPIITLIAASAVVAIAVAALLTPGALGATAAAEAAIGAWDDLPSELPLATALPQHTVLLDNQGQEFARLYSENRTDVEFAAISPNFIDALIATENARFYDQGGIDLQGIARAAVMNALGRDKQGASTITQQLVQNILITNARDDAEREVATGTSPASKIREIRYAVELNKVMTKGEILTAYSNAVFLGNGAYGVEAAAHTYFSVSAADLTVAQAALLVGMLKAPNAYDPIAHPEASVARRNQVISRMVVEKYLTPAEAEAAVGEPITITAGTVKSGCASSAYPYYCALVRDELLDNDAFGKTAEDRQESLRRGGLTVTTALSRQAMDSAQAAADKALTRDNRVATGIAIVVPGTGHIAAVAQNRSWDQTEIVYATSRFQPGSSFKPVVLATALEQGIPITQKFSANGPYNSPSMDEPSGGFKNSGGARYGTIDASSAIRQSANVYFVKLIEKTGVLPVVDMAHRLGIASIPSTLGGREAALALGSYETTPLEMANAYATFIAGGINCNPVSIVSAVRSATGEPVAVSDPGCRQEISPAVANAVAGALQGTFTAGGTLVAVGKLPDRDAGAKTGTTDGSAAVWTVGITPQFATAVWVGDPRGGQQYPLTNVTAYGKRIGTVFGASIPGPIWKDTMARIHVGLPAIAFPTAGESAIGSTTARAVPDVRGLTVDAAAATLTAAGLEWAIAAETAPADGVSVPNIVRTQSPKPGKSLAGDETITLTLTNGSDTDVKAPEAR